MHEAQIYNYDINLIEQLVLSFGIGFFYYFVIWLPIGFLNTFMFQYFFKKLNDDFEEAVKFAENSPFPDKKELYEDVYFKENAK